MPLRSRGGSCRGTWEKTGEEETGPLAESGTSSAGEVTDARRVTSLICRGTRLLLVKALWSWGRFRRASQLGAQSQGGRG